MPFFYFNLITVRYVKFYFINGSWRDLRFSCSSLCCRCASSSRFFMDGTCDRRRKADGSLRGEEPGIRCEDHQYIPRGCEAERAP
ncbi:MAG TPA: hypothetical protein H9951_05795, partial [Candidatus Bacteroides intestinigallinarum]|nr:hypothetical protein [Candidatus Bacteroides intestinigallinarum]